MTARRTRGRGTTYWTGMAAAAACVAIIAVSYRATVAWERNATQLAQERAQGAVTLLARALSHDMAGVQTTVLSDHPLIDQADPPASDPLELATATFARYPYPETFFAWRGQTGPVVFYARSDRKPAWLTPETDATLPVIRGPAPAVARSLQQRIMADARLGRRYSVFETTSASDHYQVVALLSYRDRFKQQLSSAIGFTVNLRWVREHYMQGMVAEVTRIAGAQTGIQLAVLDSGGRAVSATPTPPPRGPIGEHRFAMLFFDPRLVLIDWPEDLPRHEWVARASIVGDLTDGSAPFGARWSLRIAAASLFVLGIAFTLAVRAAQGHARLADLRADFVSTVTHELKAPIATIQTISETFAMDRGITPEVSRHHGRLALHETKRLSRLIDNLLAYSQMADVTAAYSFEMLAPRDLAEDSVAEFASQLDYGQFEVVLDAAPDLPPVRGDRRSLMLAIGNLIDNAIRYSPDGRYLGVTVRSTAEGVAFDITDHGTGIPADDIPHLTRKFFRGKAVHAGGSGLGLALVQRIAEAHGASLAFQSHVGTGTTVTLTLPRS